MSKSDWEGISGLEGESPPAGIAGPEVKCLDGGRCMAVLVGSIPTGACDILIALTSNSWSVEWTISEMCLYRFAEPKVKQKLQNIVDTQGMGHNM